MRLRCLSNALQQLWPLLDSLQDQSALELDDRPPQHAVIFQLSPDSVPHRIRQSQFDDDRPRTDDTVIARDIFRSDHLLPSTSTPVRSFFQTLPRNLLTSTVDPIAEEPGSAEDRAKHRYAMASLGP